MVYTVAVGQRGMNWGMFTNDDDGPREPPMASLLPSSLRDVWGEPTPPMTGPPNHHVAFNPGSLGHATAGVDQAGSAPSMSYMNIDPSDVTFQGEIEQDERSRTTNYFQVEFNSNRSAVFHANQRLRINIGDYVLTEADRGFDIGRVTALVSKPTPRDTKGAKMIVRTATQHEIQQLPQKAEREARALQLCQAKAAELGLSMNITGAEFQFDGKKLTFYYTATSYVDFRVLVRTLFKVFGTRIWMVWYDGQGARSEHPQQH